MDEKQAQLLKQCSQQIFSLRCQGQTAQVRVVLKKFIKEVIPPSQEAKWHDIYLQIANKEGYLFNDVLNEHEALYGEMSQDWLWEMIYRLCMKGNKEILMSTIRKTQEYKVGFTRKQCYYKVLNILNDLKQPRDDLFVFCLQNFKEEDHHFYQNTNWIMKWIQLAEQEYNTSDKLSTDTKNQVLGYFEK